VADPASGLALRLPLAILGVAGLTFLLRSERAVFIPIVVSVLISYALAPVVEWLGRRHVPRLAGALIIMTVVLGALASLAALVADDALTLLEQLPESVRQIREQFLDTRAEGGGLTERLQRAVTAIREAAAAAREAGAGGSAAPATPGDSVFHNPAIILSRASDVVVVLFLVLFLLWSGDLYRRKLLAIAGTRLSWRRATLRTLVEIESGIRRFLVVRIVTGAIVAVATWAGLQWIGLEHAAVWGLVAGTLNAIPYLGPVIVTLALLVVGLVQFGSPTMALAAAGVALVVTSLEGWLLDPLLMGKAERMNSVAILVGLVYWTAVWGAWGAFLAVPMMAILKTICDHNAELKPIGKLLGE
jgi:predicted PurR-regulated permease PerM